VEFQLNGRAVDVDPSGSLLDVLRDQCGITSTKDGCSPQGQCGCCTVWVDGSPRIACVTPVSRVQGRSVTTLEGLDSAEQWAQQCAVNGASQCGFCTPGIIMRLAALESSQLASPTAVHRALKSHLCRCTGWTPILDAARSMAAGTPVDLAPLSSPRAQARAALEGRNPQILGSQVALGGGGFASDTAPNGVHIGVAPEQVGQLEDLAQPARWRLVETLTHWRSALGAAPGRRSSLGVTWPIEQRAVPGRVVRELQTTWVEPAYLEPDCSWCEPGGEPASTHANGGAFGAKVSSPLPELVSALARDHQVPVRAQFTREQVVQWGPKRPPMAISVTTDDAEASAGSAPARYKIWISVARTAGIVEALSAVPLPSGIDLEIVEVDVAGPPTSAEIRGSGWVELAVVLSSLRTASADDPAGVVTDFVTSPEGASVEAWLDLDGAVHLRVDCGVDPNDPGEMLILRSYCMGAVHMALGWVHSEGIAVDEEGHPRDLTLRSLGIATSVEMPEVHLEVVDTAPRVDLRTPVNGSDAVFAAVAAAFWRRNRWAPRWPIRH
jgi:xanthine dehydrogenase small subunit